MFRWRLIATRLFILLLLGVAIWISRDALIRQWIVSSAQATVGAKVEIGQVYSSFADRKIFIDHITVADPRDPMSNLFQADSAVLNFDLDSLLRRKFVIHGGSTSQLVMGSPRTTTGAITDSPLAIDKNKIDDEINIDFDHPDATEAWLDQFKFAKTSLDPAQLHLTSTASRILNDRKKALSDQLGKIDGLHNKIVQINELIEGFDNNVLRISNLQLAQERMNSLRLEIENLSNSLHELDIQLASDRTELHSTRIKDQSAIQQISSVSVVEPATLTNLLLQKDPFLIEQLNNAITWYSAFGKAIPDPRKDFSVKPASGRNISFPYLSDSPSFFIKQMDLDGEGRLGGQKFSFTGEISGLTTQPELTNNPVHFKLRAQGQTHFVIDCTIDRRSSNGADNLRMICQDLPLPARTMGEESMLLLRVSPCRAKIDVNLTSDNDRLSGTMQFVYENLVTQIEELDEKAGGNNVASRINLDLGTITDYSVTANIGGTFSDPIFDFQSNLGEQLASKFNEVIGSREQVAQKQLDEILESYLSQLDREVGDKIREASELLANEVQRKRELVASNLKSRIPDSGFSERPRRY